ncbi:ANTAR domain-containing protein [Herbihabitans rhizosphaerae]|uniref:ANTAR domain-containing protein n=1 Tax=Herbihabitans rhizosphaerae TaxID=1872711 RepID=A0A4Q7KFP1_9PSEU|nr:ANTAR domain-containing protein [Herbihabitans rhizosphaerae]
MERAQRAAALAARHENLAATTDNDTLRSFHAAIAATHRRIEERHTVTATLHQTYADRLALCDKADQSSRSCAIPSFMASVATALGSTGAAVTLVGETPEASVFATSDTTAGAAQDLEYTYGEGPGRDAVRFGLTMAGHGQALCRRWPNYGPAIAELGVRSVAATPLLVVDRPIGALTVFDSSTEAPTELSGLERLADALADTLLMDSAIPESMVLYGQVDVRPTVHQAVGMVAEQNGCGASDALALIRAHAFSTDMPVTAVAEDVVARRVRLG